MVDDIDSLIREEWYVAQRAPYSYSPSKSLEEIPTIFTPKAFEVCSDDPPKGLEKTLQLVADVKNFEIHELGFIPSPNYLRYCELETARKIYRLYVTEKDLLPEECNFWIDYAEDLSHRFKPKGCLAITSDENDLKEEAKFYKGKGYDTSRRLSYDFNDGHGCDITPDFLDDALAYQVYKVLHEDFHHNAKRIFGKGRSPPLAVNESAACLVGNIGAMEFLALSHGPGSKVCWNAYRSYNRRKKRARVINRAFEAIRKSQKKEGNRILNSMRKRRARWSLWVSGYPNNNSSIMDLRPYAKHFPLFVQAYCKAGSLRGFVDLLRGAPLHEETLVKQITNYINT